VGTFLLSQVTQIMEYHAQASKSLILFFDEKHKVLFFTLRMRKKYLKDFS